MKYHCEICSYIYDSNKGDPGKDITVGTNLDDLPSSGICPLCGVGKENFYQLNENASVPSGDLEEDLAP